MSQLPLSFEAKAASRTAPQPWLLTVVDLGLVSILAVAPFLMGGQEAVGQLVLCGLATFTTLAWCLYQCRHGDGRWRFTGLEPIMLLGLGLILLQCRELTPELIRALSPMVPKLLTEWHDGSPLFPGTWNRISFTPANTWSDLVVVVASLEIFFVMVQRLRTINDVFAFIRIVALGGGAMSLFGVIQYLFGNGKFFWFYDHPMTSTLGVAKGSFANPNIFANFLALSLPAQILMLITRMSDRAQFLLIPVRESSPRFGNNHETVLIQFWGANLLVTALAILMSQSWTGVLPGALGVTLTLAIFWHKHLIPLKHAGIGLALTAFTILLTPLFTHQTNAEQATSSVSIPFSETAKLAPVKNDPWDASLAGIKDFPLAGTGLGSHREVFGLWYHSRLLLRNQIETSNGYLQIAIETGLTGLGLVILLWLTSLLWCAQGLWNSVSPKAAGLITVVTSGLIMSLVQSIASSVWYVPACVNTVLLYGVAAWRISLMRFFENDRQSRFVPDKSWGSVRLGWLATIPLVVLLGRWMVIEKIPELVATPAWNEYLRLTLAQQEQEDANPAESLDVLNRRISLVLKAAEANPRSHYVQLHAGLACLKQFTLKQAERNHQMPLSQIRDAARTLFDSPEDVNTWLNRPGVLGEERKLLESAIQHFQNSLAACPLQPRPYLELAELVWLQNGNEAIERNLVEQAVAVRPGNARAHFAMGRILWLEGAQRDAAVHWQNAFRFDPDYRTQLIDVLADYVPARFFIDHFDPDHAALQQLRTAYQSSEDSVGYQLVLENLGRSSVKRAIVLRGDEAAEEWILAHECFAELGDQKNAYHSAKEATIAAPEHYASRQTFGLWLYRNGNFKEAIPHLTWCSARKPGEQWIQTILADSIQHQESPSTKTQIATEPPESIVR